MGDHRGELSPDHVEVRGVGSVGVGRRPEDEKIKRLEERKLKLTLAGGCGCRYRGRREFGCLDSRRRRQKKHCQCACRWDCLEKNKDAFLFTKKSMDKGDYVICVVKITNTNIHLQILTMDKDNCAVEEVRHQHPVDDRCSENRHHWRCCFWWSFLQTD